MLTDSFNATAPGGATVGRTIRRNPQKAAAAATRAQITNADSREGMEEL